MTTPLKTFTFNDTPVKYHFRKATSDRRHLIVIMSGYRARGTFDFSGATAKDLKCDVLWIEDWFDANHTYYIRTGKDFGPAEAIQALIATVLQDRGLSKNECTIAGFSKGGSGALYHGIKYNYKNIISTAPRINIGSSTKIRHPDVFENMTLERSNQEAIALDLLIPTLIADDSNTHRNLYLISSPMDYQYKTEIEPFLHLYEKYDNFNYIETKSPLVREHIDVTWYNIPIILATIMALSENAPPRYGKIANGDNNFSENHRLPSIEEVSLRREVVSGFTDIKLAEGRIFPEGYSFVKGLDAGNYTDLSRFLVLNSARHTYRFRMGGVNDHRMSSRFFENIYCNYSKVKFASLKFAGISLMEIEDGIYDLGVNLRQGDHDGTTWTSTVRDIDREVNFQEKILRVSSSTGVLKLIKRPAFSPHEGEGYFSLESFWTRGSLLHVEGYFALVGFETKSWKDVSFYLLFADPTSGRISGTLRLAKDSKSGVSELVGDEWGDYSKSYFASSKYMGVDTDSFSDGAYELLVTANFSGQLFTRRLGLTARIAAGSIEVSKS